MRGRLTYANVAATLALVFAMSGGAFAASHYLINSTKQINPKVLKKLRGARGARGATGERGATGSAGASGKEGPAGKEGQPGASASASIATAFAQATPGSPIEVDEDEVLVLETKTSGKNLVLAGAGAHVLAQASVQVANSTPKSAPAEIKCQLAWEALAGGGAHLFGNVSTIVLAGEFEASGEVSLTGDVSLVGGETYDLQIYCHSKPFSGNGRVTGAAMNAFGPE